MGSVLEVERVRRLSTQRTSAVDVISPVVEVAVTSKSEMVGLAITLDAE